MVEKSKLHTICPGSCRVDFHPVIQAFNHSLINNLWALDLKRYEILKSFFKIVTVFCRKFSNFSKRKSKF